MLKSNYKIIKNEKLNKDTFKMIFEGDTTQITNAGQFINIKVPDKFLRRPISICDYDKESITIIYKVVGSGTEIMSKMGPGNILDILVGLGNGFNIDNNSKKPLLIGGGIGISTLYNLAKKLIEKEKTVSAIFSFKNKDDILYEKEFIDLGVHLDIYLEDELCKKNGSFADFLNRDYDYFYACGSKDMTKIVYDKTITSGQFSFEQKMCCGFGACMGCSIKTKNGFKRVCKEGPVFVKEELLWEN